ncbi:MAG TPA: nuclear transport factor 2 family protein [Solirubrobacteraceae bacterium]|nr:nuclear transport factor 2 family protein [Solirubrobacteraceae bacterium]
MYAFIVGLIVRRQFAHLSSGDWRKPLRFFAPDAVLRFPGDNELGGEYHGRDAIAAWFDRGWSKFGFDFTVEDVVVSGGPWNMRVGTRWHNTLRAEDGELFRYRGMQYARFRWGRLVEDELYEDTQVVTRALEHAAALDREAALA